VNSLLLKSEADTARLARVLSAALQGGDIVGLRGDLGAGKTTLVRYLVEACGGLGEHVASPSYTLQHVYALERGRSIEHWDLYRVREVPEELYEPPTNTTIRCIEWPERASLVLPAMQLLVSLTARSDGTRTVDFEGVRAAVVEQAAGK